MNESSITDVFSGRTPIVVEHQLSMPPGKILLGVLIIVGGSVLAFALKDLLKS